jgi:hypothetical protein
MRGQQDLILLTDAHSPAHCNRSWKITRSYFITRSPKITRFSHIISLGTFRPNELIFFSSLKHRYWNTCYELCFIIEGWMVSRGVSCDLLVYVIYDRSSAVRPEMQFSRLVPSLGAYIPIETDRIAFRFLIFPIHYLFLPTNRCVRSWGRTSWSSLPLPPPLLLIGK